MSNDSVVGGRSREQVVSRAAAIIRGYDDLAKIWHAIENVAYQMDGKVCNKRYSTAVNEMCKGIGRIYLEKGFNGDYHISLYIDNRWAENVGYFDKELSCTSYYVFYSHLNDGRIDADAIAKYAQEMRGHIKNAQEEWRDAADNFDVYNDALKQAIAEFGDKIAAINRLFIPTQISTYDFRRR